MNFSKLILAYMLAVGLISSAVAQENDNTRQIVRTGTAFLGGWAVGNLVISGVSLNKNEGTNYYFQEMNFYWGGVNATLAGLSLLSKKTPATMDKIYLINTFLDVLYVGGGFYMYKKSFSAENPDTRLRGYGESIMMQGAFLFLYDGIMYYALRKQKRSETTHANFSWAIAPQGFAVRYNF